MTAIATPPLTDSTDSLLRFAVRLDATLTGLLGLAVAAMADPVARLTGLTPLQGYVVGAAFVLYGVVVYALAALPELRRVGIALVAFNTAGTAGFVAIAMGDTLPLTPAGVAVTLGCSSYTAVFALLQYFGVRRLA